MNSDTGLSAGDILALTKGNNNDLMGGVGFWWVIVFLIVAGMFNGNGFGFGNNVANDSLLNEEFIKRDIFNTNQNVSNTACQTQRDVLDTKYGLGSEIQTNRYNLGTEIMQNRFNCSQNACTTQKEILQNRYDTSLGLAGIDKDILLGNQNLQAQLSSCCCTLENAIHKEGEATRNLMQQDKIDQLRDQVYSTNLALNNANLANQIINSVRPFPQPAYITCSPYQSVTGYGCGCANTVIA